MISTVKHTLDRLVDHTPDERNRVVDAARAVSIVVVVVWHWSLSITHRDGSGALVNPNPLDDVPGAWLATWVLQVLPVFFVVGGYANLAAWTSASEKGERALAFVRRRLRRLLQPVIAFVVIWLALDIAARRWLAGYRPAIDQFSIVFDPLWFIGAYLVVVVLVPITASAHGRFPRSTLAGLAVAVGTVDLVRFGLGLETIGWINLVLVWVLVHQLGYYWYDGTLTASRRWALGVAVTGLLGLVVATGLDVYPRSLVATAETDISHLTPPTIVVALAAVLQLGLILLARPWLERVLRERPVWTVVVALNAVIMTVFLWHMTALLVAILAFEGAGGTLGDEATVSWWITRPLWLIGPAIVLIPLVALMAPFEMGRITRRRRRAPDSPG
jgi:fucose 4-O-acetylase-like acetyltransferase